MLYEDLLSGERVIAVKGQDGDTFESASVIKLWIMSCAFEMFSNGELDPDKRIRLSESDMVPEPGFKDYHKDDMEGKLTGFMFPESGVLNYMRPGTELSVMDLVALMILISDNTATNILIDLIGIDKLNAHIRSIGAENTVIYRKLFDTSEEVRGKENLFSLSDAADYFRALYEGRLVSPEASACMLSILQNQQNTYKIPFFLRQIPIAHKTGEDTGIENDVGIVFSKRPFILCFASNEANEQKAVRLCQDLAFELEVQNG